MSNSEKETKTKRKPRALEIVGFIIIFLIIGLLSFVIISNLSGNIVFVFGKTTVWVMTPSMEPLIPERSYILLSKVEAKDVEVGDIILFRSDDPSIKDSFNTHRVVEIIGDHEEFVTKGDSNIAQDHYTAKADRVMGKYVKNLPILTKIGRFMYSSIGILISFTLVLGIVMIMYIPDIIKATKEKSKIIEEKKQEQIDELVQKEVERLKREHAQVEEKDLSNKE